MIIMNCNRNTTNDYKVITNNVIRMQLILILLLIKKLLIM